MLQIKRTTILNEVEKIKVPYNFLTDADCVRILDGTLLDLTKAQFCWNDIRDEILKHKHKFGDDKKIGTFVLWVDYKNEVLEISIFIVDYLYYLDK